jgi:hypothetical protein
MKLLGRLLPRKLVRPKPAPLVMPRRSFLRGLFAMPAIITTPGLLMPVKPVMAEVMKPVPLRAGASFAVGDIVEAVGGMFRCVRAGTARRFGTIEIDGRHVMIEMDDGVAAFEQLLAPRSGFEFRPVL